MNKVLGLIQHYILFKASEAEIRMIEQTLRHRHNPSIIHISNLPHDPEFLKLIQDNELLLSVKYVKDKCGLGLKEAKEFVDEFRASKSWT